MGIIAAHTPPAQGKAKHSLPRIAAAGFFVIILAVYTATSLRFTSPAPVQLSGTQQRRQKKSNKHGNSAALTNNTASSVIQTGDENLDRLQACKTIECLQKWHAKTHPKGKPAEYKFNFPHFMIVGWQKSATTSLFSYLMQHPEVAKPMSKEPHFFTSCRRAGPACRARTPDLLDEAWYIRDAFQQDYVVANGLNVAAMEASADYAQGGKPLAKLLYKSFPWLKLVFALREPISRAISWRTMMADKFDKGCTNEDRYAECIENTLSTRNYSEPLQGWLEVWPTDQLMIIQFEQLLKDPAPILTEMKAFLGLDVNLPEQYSLETGFSNVNGRNSFAKGWPMPKAAYKNLLAPQKRDAIKVAKLLDKYGVGDGDAFLANWQEIWDANLATCEGGNDGPCAIHG